MGQIVATPHTSMVEQPLPGARLALVLLLTINFFNYVDRQVLAAVESQIETAFFATEDLSDPVKRAQVGAAIGSLNFAFLVSYMVLAPLFGWLADRMGRWLLIGLGVTFWSLASGASGLAPSFAILFLTRCLVGVGEAAYGPVAPTVIADLYPLSKRSTKMAWFYAAIPVGSACGYILGGRVSALMEDWRWPFYVVVPPGLLLGVWCFLMKEPPRGQADVGATVRKAGLKDYLVLLRTPSYVLNTLGMTAMTFALGGISFYMPRYLATQRAAEFPGFVANSPELLAYVNERFGIIVVIAGLAATLLGGLAGDRLKPRFPGSYFLVSALGMFLGFPMVLLSLFLPFPLGWLFIFFACFWLFFNTGPTNTILANVTHPSLRASGFAMNILVIHALGDAISPAILGGINGYYNNMNVGFVIVSFTFLLASTFWFWGSFHLEKDTALAPTRL